MKHPADYTQLARTEYDRAAVWYERERAGLGDEFVAEIQRTLDEIAVYPDRYPTVEDGIRQVQVNRFPYSILYCIRVERIIVVAVFHNARNPSEWQSRT